VLGQEVVSGEQEAGKRVASVLSPPAASAAAETLSSRVPAAPQPRGAGPAGSGCGLGAGVPAEPGLTGRAGGDDRLAMAASVLPHLPRPGAGSGDPLPPTPGSAQLTAVGVPIETYFMHQLFNGVEVKRFMLCIPAGRELLSGRRSSRGGKGSAAVLKREERPG